MSIVKSVLSVTVLVCAGLILAQSVRLLMLKHDVTAYKKYWENRAAIKPADGALQYVVLGDSAAQGIGASQPQLGYAGLVATALAARYNRPVHVVNLSVTGATVSDLLRDQLPKLQQMNLNKNDIVTVEIGANNMAVFNETEFGAQTDQLFSQLPPQSVVADIPYFGGGRAKSRESSALAASQIIAAAAARYNLRLAPLHAVTKANDNLGDYGADFFHPSDRGYRNWYRAFAQVLNI